MIWTDLLTIFFAQLSSFLFGILQTLFGAVLGV
jgi:hypothetical protein